MNLLPKEPNKRRRRLFWAMLILVVLYALVTPTLGVFIARAQLASATQSASAIRLEEFSGSLTLTTRTLAPSEFQQVAEAVPITWDYGTPGLVRLCFTPHHRIVITSGALQREKTFAICFRCDQVKFTSGIMDSPSAWHQPLRHLFLRNTIPIRPTYSGKAVTIEAPQ